MVNKNEKTKVVIDEALAIYSVTDLMKLFNKKITLDADIEIDLKKVKKIDTAGFQFLLFMKKKYETLGRRIAFTNAGEEVTSIFNFYNEAGVLE